MVLRKTGICPGCGEYEYIGYPACKYFQKNNVPLKKRQEMLRCRACWLHDYPRNNSKKKKLLKEVERKKGI